MLVFVLNLIALKIAADSSLKCKNTFGLIIVQALKEYKGISLVIFLLTGWWRICFLIRKRPIKNTINKVPISK